VPTAAPATTPSSHEASYEYVCLVSESDTNIHVDIIRTSDANGYLAEHPTAYRMPAQGACGPTDTEKVVPTSTAIPTLPAPTAVPTVEQPSPTPTATEQPEMPAMVPPPVPAAEVVGVPEEATPAPTEPPVPVQIPPDGP